MRFSFRKTVQWPTWPEVQKKPLPGGAMLYDASRAGNADAPWFDRDWWAQRGQVRAAEEGRGAAVFIQADGRRLVLIGGGTGRAEEGRPLPWDCGGMRLATAPELIAQPEILPLRGFSA